MPALKVALAVVTAVGLVLFSSFTGHLQQTQADVAHDLTLHNEICPQEGAEPACAARLLAETTSPLGLLLAAHRQFVEEGALTDADAASLKAEWANRYERDTAGRIYPALANACADHLGNRCPRAIVLSSWAEQLRLQEPIDEWRAPPERAAAERRA